MNTVLWVAQIIVAVAFLYSGLHKATGSREALIAKGQTGIDGMPYPKIHAIAAIELLGVAGLILPWLLQIFPVLTVVSAVGFAVIMVLAARIHLRRGEPRSVALNIFLLCLALAVALGRTSMLWRVAGL